MNKNNPRGWLLCLIILMMISLTGCSTIEKHLLPERFVTEAFLADPIEPLNRGTDKFNRELDKAAIKPVAKGYRVVTPDPVDKGITNFFNNLADINSAVNNLLQFKPVRALSDVGRVCVNTTVGLLGFIDVASDIGLKNYKEDFGQTLGHWGVGDKPFLVIPLLGPSTLRDFVGRAGDLMMNPLYYSAQGIYWTALAIQFVDTRADLLETTDILEEAAVDPYAFLRETYLQTRKNKIYDGDPPLEDANFDDQIIFDDE
ncbi:MAG: VacJ family lipoprotein [Pseudomonadota bacterium]